MANKSTASPIQMPQIETWQTDSRTTSGRSNKAAGIVPLTQPESGKPQPVSNLSANSTRKTIGGATYAVVNVTHKIASSDMAYHHTAIWVTGLHGNPNPQQVSASTASPHTISFPATGDKVTITAQSVGKDGSVLPLSQSPSTAVQL